MFIVGCSSLLTTLAASSNDAVCVTSKGDGLCVTLLGYVDVCDHVVGS